MCSSDLERSGIDPATRRLINPFTQQQIADITGQTLRDIQADLLGKQYQALQTGYDTATKAAQTDLSRQLQAAQGLENIGTQQFNVGTDRTISGWGGV